MFLSSVRLSAQREVITSAATKTAVQQYSSGDSSSAASAEVEVILRQTSTIATSLPGGVSVEQMRSALNVTLCAEEPAGTCDVAYATTGGGRRRSRRLAAVSFTLIKTHDATSTDSGLAAPAVDTSALATQLGVSVHDLPAVTSTLASVRAEIKVVTTGTAAWPT